MNLTIIMAAIVAVVVILQLWTIALVVSLKKKMNTPAAGKSSSNSSFDRTDTRRDQDFRRNTRRPSETPRAQNKPQTNNNTQTQTPASADPVEKSLRDINLRLKNAERDQDVARKRITENFPRENREPRRDQDRSRGGRDNNRRDQRRDNRDSRDNRRGWQDRGGRNDYSPQESDAASEDTPSTLQMNAQSSSFDSSVKDQVERPETVITQSPTAGTVANDLGTSDESVQHGRKVLVKRRMLTEEDEQNETSSGGPESRNSQPESTPQEAAPDSSENTEIRFGRR